MENLPFTESPAYGDEQTEPDFYTMPERFLPQQKAKKAGSGKGIIVSLYILIGLVLVGAGIAVWFLFIKQEPAIEATDLKAIVPGNITSTTTATTTTNTNQPIELKFIAKDSFNNELSHVIIQLTGAIAEELAGQIKATSLLPQQMTGRAQRAIGAIYTFSAANEILFSPPAKFIFSYVEPDDLTSKKENSLQIAEETSPGIWKYLPGGKLDIVDNNISIELNSLPQGRITILSNLDEDEPLPPETDITNPPSDDDLLSVTPLVMSSDTDNDGLTDIEEIMYESNPALPDTDNDGYIDGLELSSGYSPISTNTLLFDGLVTEFSNESSGFYIHYPTSWSFQESNGEIKTVVFASGGDDFVQIAMQDNPQELNSRDWYLSMSAGLDVLALNETTIDGYQGIFSPDQANLYIAVGDKVYIMTYSAGLKTEVDYLTTFIMMQRSLKFINND